MRIDASDRERESYEEVSGGPAALENPANFWNDPLTRRRFLKRTGAATATTMLALHGMKVEMLAAAGASTTRRKVTSADYELTIYLKQDGSNWTTDFSQKGTWESAPSVTAPAVPTIIKPGPLAGNSTPTTADATTTTTAGIVLSKVSETSKWYLLNWKVNAGYPTQTSAGFTNPVAVGIANTNLEYVRCVLSVTFEWKWVF